MAQTISLLVLRLEGVLQSWGEHAKWNYRDSSTMPSKSGIMGLLGCALGWERQDSRLFDLQNQLKVIVRADRQGKLICDFHTVQSKNLLNAEGKHRGKQGEYATMVTNRYYLQDAFFTVFLIGAKDCLQQVENALQKPQWTLYRGRKSCVPSRPVLDGSVSDYETMEQVIQAIKSFPLSKRHDNKSIMLEMDFADKLEMKDNFADFSGNILLRQDELTEDYRQFANRNVMRIFINDDNKEGDANVSDKINS